MIRNELQRRCGLLGLVGVAVLAMGLAAGARSQQPKAPVANEAKAGLTKVYFGLDACYDCHSKQDPAQLKPPPVLCRCNEILIWEKGDKHREAFTSLRGPRGQQMGKLLNIPDVTQEKSCVNCHGVYVPPDKVKELTDPSFKVEDGVSCVACHGPYAEWVDAHKSTLQRNRDKWRSLTRQTKEEQYGMTDLWDPAKRNRMCASCHIGNAAEGKVVTHEMYAAGHPPLPSLEIATFSDEMPRHWEYLKQKSAEAQKILGYNPEELERVKLVVVGGAQDFQSAMELLASQAEQAAQVKDPESRLLDLAQYDCYACHHDLKRPSWRQLRGYTALPGRPQFKPWPLALVRLGMQTTAPAQSETELFDQLHRLHRAFAAEPFGKLDEIALAARDLARWGQRLTTALDQAQGKFGHENLPRLLHQLCELAAAELPDYDTARQLSWAFRVLYSEWTPPPASNAKIQEKLHALEDQLKLQLPSGQRRQILAELPVALTKRSDYDPERFQRTFQELAKLVSPK